MTPTVQPMRGLSKRAQELAKPKEFCVYSRARRTDPETSHKAAARAACFVGPHYMRILTALRIHPMTAKEIAEHTGLTVVQICRRLPEMPGACVVQQGGVALEREGMRVWMAL
jgi:hypothetical protein